jgi:hypothetical protein
VRIILPRVSLRALPLRRAGSIVGHMKRRKKFGERVFAIFCAGFVLSYALQGTAEQPSSAATATWNAYIATVEARLARQHASHDEFLAGEMANSQNEERLRRGERIIDQLTPAAGADLPGALLHHWRGTAFAPGATARDFAQTMRDFAGYPQIYAPQVLESRVLDQHGDEYQVRMRVRQKHVLTVTLDTTYDVLFGRLDKQHGFSISRSTRIAEIGSKGRAQPSADDHGFLWRQNTYWTYEERDGGLYLQIESISLTRGIPPGLGWVVGPFVASVPRESMEFTLASTCRALREAQPATGERKLR